MRLGATRRGALALLGALIFATGTASAGLFHRTIPRETAAINLSTGQPYYAPPIPYGHYAKDKVGYVQEKIGMAKGAVGGLFHHGNACNSCGGRGCAFCSGTGLAPGATLPCADCGTAVDGGRGLGHKFGKHSDPHHGAGRATVIETTSFGTPQAAPSCQSCGDRGCGLCQGKKGRGKKHGFGGGGICGNCGGAGCGLCANRGGGGICGNCGGAGCGLCGGNGHGLGAGAHGLLGTLKGRLLAKITHAGQIEYFVGPGGPVPLTPGYVPYINVTRSPRDYFAFPPFADNVP